MKDIDVEGGLSTPRDCRASTFLKHFGDAIVDDCGTVEGEYDAEGNPLKSLLAARACTARALSARRPFVMRWHDSGSDPTCTTWSTGDTACGGYSKHQIWMVVGVLEGGEYRTYQIDYDWTHFQAAAGEPRPSLLTGIAVSSRSTVHRCASMSSVGDWVDECGLRSCFQCREGDELATCESDREL